jgi:hypothetical protein
MVKVMVCTRVGAVGLNFTEANHVIHMAFGWNPSHQRQGTSRVHRLGQTRPVHEYVITTEGTVEAYMEHVCSDKHDMESNIMDNVMRMFEQKTHTQAQPSISIPSQPSIMAPRQQTAAVLGSLASAATDPNTIPFPSHAPILSRSHQANVLTAQTPLAPLPTSSSKPSQRENVVSSSISRSLPSNQTLPPVPLAHGPNHMPQTRKNRPVSLTGLERSVESMGL